jgi:Cu(I)/Ag(I) efflux system membrane fusion protein
MNEQQSAGGVMLPGAPQQGGQEDTTPPPSARRGVLPLFIVLALGAAAGAGFTWAHFTGRLASLYHALGIHGAHEAEGPAGAPPALGEHAGHGGMKMPKAEGAEASKLPGYAVVKITPEKQQAIGVRTGKVQRGGLRMSIQAVGIVEPDQTRLARIHTRVSGWVTKVHVNFVGQDVTKDHPLLELYSPDLMRAQLDYIQSLDSWETQGKTEPMRRLVEATRRQLELWGVPPDEIKKMETPPRKPRDTLQLRAPIDGRVLERNVQAGSYVEPAMDLYRIADLSVVWLQAKVYEYELPHVEVGQPVHISVAGRPDLKDVPGKVSFIEPVFQEATRTVKVRVALANEGGRFKPGMYADLVIDHDMSQVPRPVEVADTFGLLGAPVGPGALLAASALTAVRTGLLVPEDGILRTGERNLAFRLLPGDRFEPVEVTLGARFKDRVEVLAGLEEGDEIVTSAAFLIDAESRLKSALAGMSGHQHDAAPKKPEPPPEDHKGHEHHQHGPAPDPHEGHKGHEHHEH